MSSTPKIIIKRGDTFRLICSVQSEEGPINIEGWSIRSHVRKNRVLAGRLEATIEDAPNGVYKLLEEEPGITRGWAPGNYHMDIEYTTGEGVVVSSETIDVEVKPDVTYDE